MTVKTLYFRHLIIMNIILKRIFQNKIMNDLFVKYMIDICFIIG